jgi:hypothetical protein
MLNINLIYCANLVQNMKYFLVYSDQWSPGAISKFGRFGIPNMVLTNCRLTCYELPLCFSELFFNVWKKIGSDSSREHSTCMDSIQNLF